MWTAFSFGVIPVSYTHLGLAALGADGHDLGCVHSTLSLDDTALLALTAGLDVLSNHVLALNDDLVLRGADLQDLTLSLIHIYPGAYLERQVMRPFDKS